MPESSLTFEFSILLPIQHSTRSVRHRWLRIMHDDLKQYATRRPPTPYPQRLALELRHLASSRRLLSRDSWLFPGR
jgi:hypothetical protein